MQADVAVFRALNGLVGSGGLLDALVIFCARFLPYIAILVVIWHLWLKRRDIFSLLDQGFAVFAPAILSCFVFTQILKEIIARPRPFMSLPGVHLLVNIDGFAFPSAHAAFFFALGLAMFYLDKAFGKRILVIAVVISVARVVAGVHYPLDILGGAVLGLLVAYFVNLWSQRSLQ